jgi:Domain of unknown function (DUF397)
MTNTQPGVMQWRKSSYSNGQANCVEVATMQTGSATVGIRDSKAEDGKYLAFTTRVWRQLIKDVHSSVRR